MEPVEKERLLNMLDNTVERHLQIATNCFQNLHDDKLLRPSSSGGWNIAQCLEHLNRYGRYYLPEIARALKKSTDGTVASQFKSTWLGSRFTKMMQPGTQMKKMKTFKAYNPPIRLDAGAVVAEFIQHQEDLLKYVRTAHARSLEVRVPISLTRLIRLKLGDVLQFVIIHNERHLQQALRNVKDTEMKGSD